MKPLYLNIAHNRPVFQVFANTMQIRTIVNLSKGVFILLILLHTSCRSAKTELLASLEINEKVKNKFAPDKRVALYQISITEKNKQLLLTGETNMPEALDQLKKELSMNNYVFTDSVHILPDMALGELRYAVVNNSVANLRSEGRHAAELATQALLGTPLKVLKTNGDFYLVQTPDHYLSWVDHGGIKLMGLKDYEQWLGSEKLIYLQSYGFVFSDKSRDKKLADLVLGSILKINGQDEKVYFVEFPDGRTGLVDKNEAMNFADWLAKLQPGPELIEKYGRELMGVPYLWGGTSAKGFDCSGFTKTVYFMNGYIVPRDASQQIFAGKIVDTDLKFEGLEKGDLMFFGNKATPDKKPKVTHVGIWLGNGEFIHASKQVRVSSINQGSSLFDKANVDKYLGSRRYLNQTDPGIHNLNSLFARP
jgi:hypothetical protein